MGISEIYGTKGAQLRHKRILIGVTGSIAAIEVHHLIREILRYEGDPIVVLSEEATRLVAIDALTWCMDKDPITQISGISEHVKWISHSEYKVDLCVICPATANTISKLANGIADGPVTLAALAIFGANIPMLIVPAAHTVLLDNPIVKRNIQLLKKHNVHFLTSDEEENKYKFPSLSKLMNQIFKLIGSSEKLRGRKFLITGGATREYLDDVRFLSNPSTGISALYVAEALNRQGAQVLLVLGEGNNLNMEDITVPTKLVRSTQEMYETINEELSNGYHGFIAVAAVSDYKPQYQSGKISSRQTDLTIDLVPTVKIVENIRKNFPNLYIVAYKAEVGISEEALIQKGKELLERYQLDMVCANWVGVAEKGFASKTNELFLIQSKAHHLHLKGSKVMIGEHIAKVITESFNIRSVDH
ncbi:MAG: bifunctional phosphopantothenoylcysteine decarboxylase/phosphopantothenate--cysteine ligase CoaBC [Promethearchaeota archaeon]